MNPTKTGVYSTDSERVRVMVFNVTFNNISVLLMEETGVTDKLYICPVIPTTRFTDTYP
jgi:hypothetical protein